MTTNDDFLTSVFGENRLILNSCHIAEAENKRFFDDSPTTRGRLAADLPQTGRRLSVWLSNSEPTSYNPDDDEDADNH